MKRSIGICLLAASALSTACSEYTVDVGCKEGATKRVEGGRSENSYYECIEGKYWERVYCPSGISEEGNKIKCKDCMYDCKYGCDSTTGECINFECIEGVNNTSTGECECPEKCAGECNQDGTCKCTSNDCVYGCDSTTGKCNNFECIEGVNNTSTGECECSEKCAGECYPDGTCKCMQMPCKVGEQRCENDQVEECLLAENGCFIWETKSLCEAGTTCSIVDNYTGFGVQMINSKDNSEQLNPALAMHRTTGTMVAVWEDDSSEEDGYVRKGSKKDQPCHDIEARIFYGGGCEKVAQFTALITKKGDQMTPAVAMDDNGNFVIVWCDDTDNNGSYDVWMKGFDENGRERIKERIVHTNDNRQQLNPAIAMAPDGRFVIVWQDESQNEGEPQIFIRGFDSNGIPTFDDRNVETEAGKREKPDIAIADNGSFVVTWEEHTNDNTINIRAKGFNANGTDRIETFMVNTVQNKASDPAISMNGDGVFYIAYKDNSDGKSRIKAHGYNADGNERTSDMAISDDGEEASEPDLCVNSKNEVSYTWTAVANDSSNIKRRAYRNNSLGAITNISRDNYQNQPVTACTNDGKSAILWHDDLDGNGTFDIFGRGFKEM